MLIWIKASEWFAQGSIVEQASVHISDLSRYHIQEHNWSKAVHATEIQESRAIAKMTARWALYMDALKKFGVPGYAHGYFSRNC